MTKRARLDDDGRRVRELELELELARLRRQDKQDDDGRSGEVTATGGAGELSAVDNVTAPPPTPQSGTSSAPVATAPSTTAPAATKPSTTAPPTSRGRGRGRGARGGRFSSLDHRGLQMVFVCVACDKIYCQACNTYERSLDYWNRQ